MAEIVFFASIRESLGCDRMSVDLAGEVRVSALVETLADEHGAIWRDTLTAENVRVAVNQELITTDMLVKPGDEIAFFPPVTGG